jgi:hypothetical protein
MGDYQERDAAHDAKVPEREVTATWHQARDDSGVRGNRGDDRPTRENREQARELTRKIIDRGRERGPEDRDSSRPER